MAFNHAVLEELFVKHGDLSTSPHPIGNYSFRPAASKKVRREEFRVPHAPKAVCVHGFAVDGFASIGPV